MAKKRKPTRKTDRRPTRRPAARREKHHHHGDGELRAIRSQLGEALERIAALERKDRKIMTKIDDVKALVRAVKDETDNLATRISAKDEEQDATIQALKDKIANGEVVTAEDLDGVKLDLTAEVDRLKSIGADPADPIPAEPPVEG